MAISYNKRELEKKRAQKKQEKLKRKEERKANAGDGSLENMIAYVDENGVITDTPPDVNQKQEIELENIEISTPKKEEAEDPVFSGRVEYLNSDKGYGFIKDLGSVEKYFFHISNAPESISQGNLVTFELERGQKGLNAVRVTLTDKATSNNN